MKTTYLYKLTACAYFSNNKAVSLQTRMTVERERERVKEKDGETYPNILIWLNLKLKLSNTLNTPKKLSGLKHSFLTITLFHFQKYFYILTAISGKYSYFSCLT